MVTLVAILFAWRLISVAAAELRKLATPEQTSSSKQLKAALDSPAIIRNLVALQLVVTRGPIIIGLAVIVVVEFQAASLITILYSIKTNQTGATGSKDSQSTKADLAAIVELNSKWD